MKFLLLFLILTLVLSVLGMAYRSGALKQAWVEVRPFVLWAAIAAVSVLALIFIAYSGGYVSLLH